MRVAYKYLQGAKSVFMWVIVKYYNQFLLQFSQNQKKLAEKQKFVGACDLIRNAQPQ